MRRYHHFSKGQSLPKLVTQGPHIAFQVDDLDAKIQGCKIPHQKRSRVYD